MSLGNKMINIGDSTWYSPDFRTVLEDHMTYLRNHPDTQVQVVDASALIKYRFDMFSLFFFYRAEAYTHWVIMRMNEYNSPTEDFSNMGSYIYPSTKILGQILQHYRSQMRPRGS